MSQAARIKCLWGLSAIFATVALALAIFFIMSSAGAAAYTYYVYTPEETEAAFIERCKQQGSGGSGPCERRGESCDSVPTEECIPDECVPPTT